MGGWGGKGGGKGKMVMVWQPAWQPAWGKSKGKGKGKGKGKKRKEPISEEKLAEIAEKHESRAADEGRTPVGNAFFTGELVKRQAKSGWIKPTNMAKLPGNVKSKMKEMVAQRKANAEEHGHGDKGTFDEPVIYVRMCDVAPKTKISVGDAVKFKLYTDNEGVGAFEVTTA